MITSIKYLYYLQEIEIAEVCTIMPELTLQLRFRKKTRNYNVLQQK